MLGGPGSGKTTVALRKAVARIRAALKPGQKVMFLSFSRAAVTRVLDAARVDVPKKELALLSVQTFHAFFWSLLKCHAYLLGVPRKLSILLPHDEKALSNGVDDDDDAWEAWMAERDRLFREEGRVAFALFAANAAELLRRCSYLAPLCGAAYPLIIVDEAQDTGSDAWRCLRLLAPHTQLVCLGDLDQQIYDFLPGVGPERIAEIREALNPLEVDLGGDNGRSPDTEILAFGNDILTGRPRGSHYKGVQAIRYAPQGVNWNVLLRRSFKAIFDAANAAGREMPKSIAVITDTGRNALRVSNALNALGDSNAGKVIPHKLHFDEAEALLTARLAAFLLEPKNESREADDLATCLDLLANSRRATGTGRAETDTLLRHAAELRAGKSMKVNIVKALRTVLQSLRQVGFTGDPAADWLLAKRALRETGQKELLRAVRQLDYLVAFQRGHRISAALSEEWLRDGAYTRARAALDGALAQEQILDGADFSHGLHVMNVHKAKGKQFDGVVLIRSSRHTKESLESTFVWRGDKAPYTKSRRLLRVAATRAREHLLVLDPVWPACPLLEGHSL